MEHKNSSTHRRKSFGPHTAADFSLWCAELTEASGVNGPIDHILDKTLSTPSPLIFPSLYLSGISSSIRYRDPHCTVDNDMVFKIAEKVGLSRVLLL